MRNLTKTGVFINSKIGKAIHDYDLIEDDDRILVGVSGGKDSLTLLTLLAEIRKWAPVRFELVAAHVISDLQPENEEHISFLTKVFKDLKIEYRFKNIKVIDEERKVTCFWCSWNRRKALFEMADELKCNKLALAHHKDDIVETMLMNLIYNGEISAINPRQELFRGKITIIRPLCYVEESMTEKFAGERGFSEFTCDCPFERDTRRAFIKNFIREAEENGSKMNIKTNIFKSIARIKQEYIGLKEEKG